MFNFTHFKILFLAAVINFLSILDSYSERDVILVWENRSDGGLSIALHDLPQHNITETLTMQIRTEYMSGKYYPLLFFVSKDKQIKTCMNVYSYT